MTTNNAIMFLAAAALLGGCAAQEDANIPSDLDDDGKADVWGEDGDEAVIIDEAGVGQTFDVLEGQYVVVRLPSNPVTGYDWQVVSTDRTFGYPEVTDFISDDSGRPGSGGITELVWVTEGMFPMVGSHTVVLGYVRSWEEDVEPEQTFTFTVSIISNGEPTSGDAVIDESGDGQTFDVVEGVAVVVQLPSNPSTGYDWQVVTTDRTFGYPSVTNFILDESAPDGSGGITEFIWATEGISSMVGSHTVVLGYVRSWEEDAEPEQTFTFTVNIVSADVQECVPVTCELFCDYGFERDEEGCEICSCADYPEYSCYDVVEIVEACVLEGETLEACVSGLEDALFEVVEICCEDGEYMFCDAL